MKNTPISLGILIAAASSAFASGGIQLLRVSEQAHTESAPALVSGQPATLELLLPPGERTMDLKPRWRQIGGNVSSPLELPYDLNQSTTDERITLLRVTPPTVNLVTSLQLFVGQFGPIVVVVFPAGERRNDLTPLTDALEASRLRLAVCGQAPGLREFLHAQKLDFEDEGNDAPRQLASDTLLIGDLTPGDWDRLTRDPLESGHLVAFVAAPQLMPGVYAQNTTPLRHFVKITLPILPLLSTNPRARETLHLLLLNVLKPTQP